MPRASSSATTHVCLGQLLLRGWPAFSVKSQRAGILLNVACKQPFENIKPTLGSRVYGNRPWAVLVTLIRHHQNTVLPPHPSQNRDNPVSLSVSHSDQQTPWRRAMGLLGRQGQGLSARPKPHPSGQNLEGCCWVGAGFRGKAKQGKPVAPERH